MKWIATCFLLIPLISIVQGCREDTPELCADQVFCNLDVEPYLRSDTIYFSLSSEKKMVLKTEVFEVNGKLLVQQEAPIIHGENNLFLILESVENGVYFFKISSTISDHYLTAKVLKK